MKKIVMMISSMLMLSMAVQAGMLADYGFDSATRAADESNAGITAGNFLSRGVVAATDGKADPFGLPAWKKFSSSALNTITLTPNAGAVSYANLSFAVQMDTAAGTRERKLEVTSSATGATVLFTLWNFHGYAVEGSGSTAINRIGAGWETRSIDLSGVTALQGLSSAVTFSFTFSDVSTGTPAKANMRMDDILMEGSVIPEPATLGLISMAGAVY